MADQPKPRSCPDFVAMLEEGASRASITKQIVSCFKDTLAKAAYRQCGHSDMAQDTFQDTIRLALESIHQYRGDAPIEAWLRKLVRTACSRQRRGRKNDSRLHVTWEDLAPGQQPAAQTDASAEIQTLFKERLAILGRLLTNIEEPNRSLFLRHEGEDEPIAALAKHFSLSQNAVKSRLARTRKELREQLLKISRGEEPI